MTAESFAALVAAYGYAATFVGTVAEGETVLVLSGIAARNEYLRLSPLLALGAAAAVLTDNGFFLLGRIFGPALLARFPRLAPSVARAHALVERFPNTAVIGLRFMYGMRSVGPCVIGAGTIAWSRFLALDLIAASIWSTVWVAAGYALGEAAQQLLGAFPRGQGLLLLSGLALAAAGAVLVALSRRRRRTQGSEARPSKHLR